MKKILYKSLALVFATVALSSCLKDDSYVLDPDKAAANVIDFQNPTDIGAVGTTNPLYIYSFPIQPTPTAIDLTVSYSGAEDAAPKDITVNIGLAAQSVIDTYNAEQTKTFLMMPSSWYTLSATSVVIPKGKKTASFKVNVSTSLIDLTKTYVLPLKLTSADAVVSANFGTALFQIGAKNKYDGIYKPTAGQMQRYSSPTTPTTGDALNGFMGNNADMTLSTVDANTVLVAGLRWGSSVAGAGSGSGVAGIDNLQFYVDPVTNNVTCKSLANATLANIPGTVNKYDPATKTFTVSFDWNQTATKREIKGLVLNFSKARP